MLFPTADACGLRLMEALHLPEIPQDPYDGQPLRYRRLVDGVDDWMPSHLISNLILRHLEELSFPDVARRMHRSLDSVKNLWTRALARLRRAPGESP